MPALTALPSRGMCPGHLFHGLSLVYHCHCHLQCFDAPPLFVACLNASFLLPCCLCLVDGALTGSGNCSDVWKVWYSSARFTTESRRGTRTSIRQNSLLSSFPFLSELIVLHQAVSEKRLRRTLLPSVHFSEPSVGIRSCPAF